MQADTFWQIISSARSGADDPSDAEQVAARTTDLLAQRPAEEIIGFATVFAGLQDEAFRWDLWAAAYLINGGCSDDSFQDFRAWLIAQGRDVWTAALADPDSLADVVDDDDPDILWEDMLYTAREAWNRVTPAGQPDGSFDASVDRKAAGDVLPAPAGEDFDFDDDTQMRARLPRLAALYLT